MSGPSTRSSTAGDRLDSLEERMTHMESRMECMEARIMEGVDTRIQPLQAQFQEVLDLLRSQKSSQVQPPP